MAIDKKVNISLEASDEATPKITKIAKAVEGLTKENEQLNKTYSSLSESSQGFLRGLGSELASVTKTAVAFVGAWAGAKVITKTFPAIEAAMGRTALASINLANKAAEIRVPYNRLSVLSGSLTKNLQILSSQGLEAVGKGLGSLKTSLMAVRSNLEASVLVTKSVTNATLGTGKAFLAAAKHTELLEKGLGGMVIRASIGASVFSALGASLLTSDGIMKKMAGVTLIGLALALGGVVAVIHQLLNAVGNVIISIGDKLTAATEKQIKDFSKAEQTTYAFNQTISAYAKNSEEAAKSTDEWTNFQIAQTNATGAQAATMRAMIAETISATEAAGLNVAQQKELIKASIDLSERAHKPQIDTLTALINAMNGNSQAVIALGLHINDTAIQHSKLSQSQKDNFKTASEAERAQTRLAVIMEQSGKAAGFATANADLYSKAIKLQKNAQETLNAELGRGSVIINGEYRLGLATATNALTNFFKPILPGVGFLQALGGRVLQVTGFLAKNLLTITLLTSAYRALNILLAKGFAGGAFGKQLPFINKSIGQMAKNLGATNIKFNSLKGVAKGGLQIIAKQSANGAKALLGLDSAAKITAGSVGTQMVKGFANVAKGIGLATKASLAFLATPMGLTIAAIVLGALLLYKAFQKLEQETGIFSEIWADLEESFSGTSEVLAPLYTILKEIGIVLAKVIGVQVKLAAAALSQMVANVFRVILAFQKLSTFLPGSMGASAAAIAKTEERIAKLNAASKKLALGAINDIGDIFLNSAEASAKSMIAMERWRKELAEASIAVGKYEEKSKKAFEFASEFTPNINLNKFKKKAAGFESTLIQLQGALEDKKITLINAPEQTAEIKKALEETISKIADAEEAIQGVRLKKAQEIRNARLSEVSMELQTQKQKVFSVEQEIKQMRLDAATDTRDQLVLIETQRLLDQRGLLSAQAQAGISIKQQAALEANSIELEAFRSRLNAERELALTAEQQKQNEIISLRASLLQGTTAGAQAKEDAEVVNERQKIQALEVLQQQRLISTAQFEKDRAAITMAGRQRSFELEMQFELERANALGLSPEAMQARIDAQARQDAMELEQLTFKLQNKQLTEKDFATAKEQLAFASEERIAKIKEDHLTKELERAKRQGSFMDRIRIQSEINQIKGAGKVSTAKAFFQSQEVSHAQSALGNLATLTSSSNEKMFKIGKAAALASAVVNTARAFTLALAEGGPIMGPILGATILAAGGVQIANIKAQKFSGASSAGSGSTAAPVAPTPSATQGGQADSGMDAVPRSLNGKSFILSAGERVVQPEANKKLTSFLDNVENGGIGGGSTFNINIGTVDSNERIDQIVLKVKEVIREDSERGETIISSKGVA